MSASFTTESIIDVTYHLVEDPDCCEWQFLYPDFAVWEKLDAVGVMGLVSCMAPNSRHVTDAPRLRAVEPCIEIPKERIHYLPLDGSLLPFHLSSFS